MVPTWLYVLFVIAGFSIVLILYWKYRKPVEPFASVCVDVDDNLLKTSASASKPTEEPKSEVKDMPKKTNIVLYLNAFASATPKYQCQSTTWCDAINDTKKFIITGTNVPTAISRTDGLSLKGMELTGPPSHTLSTPEDNYTIGSFTLAYYGKFPSVGSTSWSFAAPNAKQVIFDAPAQTPNSMTLYLEQHPTVSTDVNVQLSYGSNCPSESTYTWQVTKGELGGGKNVMITVVYDSAAKKLEMYRDKMTTASKNYSVNSPPNIKMAMSPIKIGKEKALDSSMVALVYFNAALSSTEVAELFDHFEQQSSGLADTLLQAEEYRAQVAAAQQEADKYRLTVSEMQKMLQKCSAETEAVKPAEPKKSWNVQMPDGTQNVKAANIEQCNLSVKVPSAQPTVARTNIVEVPKVSTVAPPVESEKSNMVSWIDKLTSWFG